MNMRSEQIFWFCCVKYYLGADKVCTVLGIIILNTQNSNRLISCVTCIPAHFHRLIMTNLRYRHCIILWTFSKYLKTHNLQTEFLPVWIKKIFKNSMFSSWHCNQNCFEHFMHFWCSFSEFETKLNNSAFFLQNHRLHLTCMTMNTWWEGTKVVLLQKSLDGLKQQPVILQHLVAESVPLAIHGANGEVTFIWYTQHPLQWAHCDANLRWLFFSSLRFTRCQYQGRLIGFVTCCVGTAS